MNKKLLENIGGTTTLHSIVNHWYDRVLDDVMLAHFFELVNMEWLKQKMVHFLEVLLTNGRYEMGGQIQESHAELGIQMAHFNAFIGHLNMTLDELEIKEEYIEDIIDLVLETKEDVLSKKVEVEANNTPPNQNENMTTQKNGDYEALLQKALDASFARMEFDKEGRIVDVNQNFATILGYTDPSEIIDSHHSIFIEKEYKLSIDYEAFWTNLKKGIVQEGTFKHTTRDNRNIWVQAAYTPLLGDNGEIIRVIKIATDVTKEKENTMNAVGLKTAVDTSFARIEFDKNGNILDANDNFTKLLGYGDVSELRGQHHSIFVNERYKVSEDYQMFWANLNNGKSHTGEFERVLRDGTVVWIQAVYTPIRDENGAIEKIIKIATNITNQKQFLQEINKVIISAGEEGKLDARLDASQATGDWKELASSVNLLLESVAMPVMELSEVVGALAKGDLTERFDSFIEGDIKQLGDELNTAIDSINVLMGQISQIGNLVAASAEEMLVKGEEMKNTTQEVASATQQMAEGAQQQAQQTDEASKMMDNVLKAVDIMAEKAGLINESAVEGQKNSTEGLSTIKLVANSMNEIQDSAVSTSESIEILSERSEEIASALSVITDIAAQTNLLALNAAIEAARAGDAGRGFAVVAEEIRKLAEGSRKSAVDIEKVIKEVQKDILAASKAIDSMESNVKSGMAASREAEAVFENIESASNETLDLSKEIVEATEDQKESINATAKNIEKIVVVAEETASGTEQVASSSKVLSQGMNEVTATSEDLANVANQLQESISKFKLQ
ncbi:methyl-accepting chemotaxis protein [Aureispira anguillae]|uniref:Methyl-accepting chemotaxis protein n=1 Tax=Aureispira anguillae TaxID=2864201 RepID=A0A916DQL6_9BACT|nr:methyl-accepting chemotaxis protein [Aureispira anguillae]BDS09777.1 methyl-accepting chemotaxis protein [Aureispira anguillae]